MKFTVTTAKTWITTGTTAITQHTLRDGEERPRDEESGLALRHVLAEPTAPPTTLPDVHGEVERREDVQNDGAERNKRPLPRRDRPASTSPGPPGNRTLSYVDRKL